MRALGVWGQRWLRRELADHEMDASLLLWAMQRGAHHNAFGTRKGVVKLTFSDRPGGKRHYWFVTEKGATELCVHDPGYDVNLYVTTTLPDMIYVWRGDLPLARALDEGRLEAIGDGWARRAFPRWLARSSYAHVKSQREDAGTPPASRRRTRAITSPPEHIAPG